MMSLFGLSGSPKEKKDREFQVVIYENDYKELCAWVLRKPHIETGGDLFGLWADKYSAVIQLVLGPGKGCRRTTTSFYQDINYLEKIGKRMTQKEGVCHIGEWHSHHQLGLARPSGGDESTVWNNMPTYNLSRFVIFIANIGHSQQSYSVNVGCFLFEIDSNGRQLPVLKGRFRILHQESPFFQKLEKIKRREEEEKKGDEFDLDIKDLTLTPQTEGMKSPAVTMNRPGPTKPKRTYGRDGEQNNQPQKKNKRDSPSQNTTKKESRTGKQTDLQASSNTAKNELEDLKTNAKEEEGQKQQQETGNKIQEDTGSKETDVEMQDSQKEQENLQAAGIEEKANEVEQKTGKKSNNEEQNRTNTSQIQQKDDDCQIEGGILDTNVDQGKATEPLATETERRESSPVTAQHQLGKQNDSEHLRNKQGDTTKEGAGQNEENKGIEPNRKEGMQKDNKEEQKAPKTNEKVGEDQNRGIKGVEGGVQKQGGSRVTNGSSVPDSLTERQGSLDTKQEAANDAEGQCPDLSNSEDQSAEIKTQENDRNKSGESLSNKEKLTENTGESAEHQGKSTCATDPSLTKNKEAKEKTRQGGTSGQAPSSKGNEQGKQSLSKRNPPKKSVRLDIKLKRPGQAKKNKINCQVWIK